MTSLWGYIGPITRLRQVAACLALGTISEAKFSVITWPWMSLSVVWCRLALEEAVSTDQHQWSNRSSNHIWPTLGLTLAQSLNWNAHFFTSEHWESGARHSGNSYQNIVFKANTKTYFLVVLGRAGTSVEELVKFYTTFIRPGLQYAAPGWHPGLTQQLSDSVERV